MKKDKDITKVIFRVYPEGDVIALFPEIAADSLGNCLSYMRVGQHGGADYTYVVQLTKPATFEQYAGLFEELESIGYNLQVCKRISWTMTYKMHRGLK